MCAFEWILAVSNSKEKLTLETRFTLFNGKCAWMSYTTRIALCIALCIALLN